jgi:hypothetical protein
MTLPWSESTLKSGDENLCHCWDRFGLDLSVARAVGAFDPPQSHLGSRAVGLTHEHDVARSGVGSAAQARLGRGERVVEVGAEIRQVLFGQTEGFEQLRRDDGLVVADLHGEALAVDAGDNVGQVDS